MLRRIIQESKEQYKLWGLRDEATTMQELSSIVIIITLQ